MVQISSLGIPLVPVIDWFTLVAQSFADGTITLPFTAKSDETQSTSATQSQVITRRPAPSSLANAVNSKEVSITGTSDNTTVINGLRFFLDEKFLATTGILGSVRFKTLIQVKSANASGTAYLQQVVFKLRALTANDTYRDLATKTVTVNFSTTSTSYVDKEIIGIVDVTDQSVATGEKLVLEITTNGKASSASYAAYHNLKFTAGGSETFVEFGV